MNETLLGAAPPQVMVEDAVRYEILRPGDLRREGSLASLSPHSRWLPVLHKGLSQQPYCVTAFRGTDRVGCLPLAFLKSALFGRFLVSLPFVNAAGPEARDEDIARQLIDRAVQLADELDVRYLELRNEREWLHPALTQKNESKQIMRLELPETTEQLMATFKSKLRSQIRSGEKHGFKVQWGTHDLLHDFYAVFSRNMRDLGTPVFPQRLFAAILDQFAGQAELCVLHLQSKPVAAALLMHGDGVTEVPSASSLREFNSTNANMVMYWHLLARTVERGQKVFDFGRSTADSNTFRFKKQWGAEPHPSIWQYYVRKGSIGDMRPTNSKFGLAIRVWQKLPVALTRWLGPMIVRGIP